MYKGVRELSKTDILAVYCMEEVTSSKPYSCLFG